MMRVTFINSSTASWPSLALFMNTASGDCGGTGGSSVADISHKLVSPINIDRWVYNTDELISTRNDANNLHGVGIFQIVQMS